MDFFLEFSAFDAQCSAGAVEGRNSNHCVGKIFVIANSERFSRFSTSWRQLEFRLQSVLTGINSSHGKKSCCR